MAKDYFKSRDVLKIGNKNYSIYRLDALEKAGLTKLNRLPFSIRIMLEAALRQCNDREITQEDVRNIAAWTPAPPAKGATRPGIPFLPARVIMQDFTGVPAVVDLAAMRAAVARLGGDPKKINPLVPVDLVIDHSVQVDFFATADALQRNAEMEFQRNRERYEFLKWGQKAFSNFRVVPPATGIVHQVNLEYLAQVVLAKKEGLGASEVLFPDTLIGTDSHTTMINGLGVVGWGVGGIEAEAVMLGQPMDMLLPDVIGFKLYRQTPGRHHRHRPGADRHPDAAQEGRGGQDRRILRARPGQHVAARPRHHCQHGSRIRGDDGLLPGGRRDAAVHETDQPPGGSHRTNRSLLPGAGIVPRNELPRIRNIPTPWNWTWEAWSPPWRDPSARRTG